METTFTKIIFGLMIGILLLTFWLRLDQLDTLPPGLSTDEAKNTVDGFILGHTGKLPLYESIGRPEPLAYFILALGTRLFGTSAWAFRITSVFIGTLTVALTYWAMRKCVDDQPPAIKAIAGLAAAIALAVAMNHIVLSRSLYRALLQPIFMLLFIGLLMRGLQTNRRRNFILSGISLGLALHVYTAALIIPTVLPFVAFHLLFFRFKTWREWMPNLIWLGLAFAVVIVPIGWMLITDSDRILARTDDLNSRLTLDTIHKSLKSIYDQFFYHGDINAQYNANYAPLLPPTFDLIFKLGMIALLLRIRHPSTIIIVVLLLLCTIPVLLAHEIPHGLRIIGEFAIFPLVIGAGIASALAIICSLKIKGITHPTSNGVYTVVTVALLGLTINNAHAVHQDYINWWEHDDYSWHVYERDLSHGDWFFRTDLRDLSQWLSDQKMPLLVPATAVRSPVMRTWLFPAYPNMTAIDEAIDIPANTLLVVPWALELGDIRRNARQYVLLQGDTITLLPPFSTETHATLLSAIDSTEAIWQDNDDLMVRVRPVPEDITIFFEPRTTPASSEPLVTFDGEIELVGWRGPDTLVTSEAQTITYTLDWSARGSIDHYYSAFVQLQTQSYERLAGDEGPLWRFLYPPVLWQTDDTVSVPYTFEIPADLSPGAYRLVVGLYLGDFPHNQVSVQHATGETMGNIATVGWIKVPQSNIPQPEQAAQVLDATLGETFALHSAQAFIDEQQIHLILTWEALVERPAIDATIFVHVLDANNTLITQSDMRPWNDQYPTFIWSQGEYIQTEHILDIGATDSRTVRLVAGMYTFPDITRLPVIQNGETTVHQTIDLGQLDDLWVQ